MELGAAESATVEQPSGYRDLPILHAGSDLGEENIVLLETCEGLLLQVSVSHMTGRVDAPCFGLDRSHGYLGDEVVVAGLVIESARVDIAQFLQRRPHP